MKLVLLITVLILGACSETVEPVSEQASGVQPNTEKPLSAYQESLKKAKEVEKQLLEAAEKKKKAIDDQL